MLVLVVRSCSGGAELCPAVGVPDVPPSQLTGQCPCRDGFTGQSCSALGQQQCPPRHYRDAQGGCTGTALAWPGVPVSHQGFIGEKEQLAHVLTSLLPCCLAREISSLEHLPVHPQYAPVPSQQPWESPGPCWAGPAGSGAVPAPGALPVPPLSQLLWEGTDVRLGWDLINPN